MKYLPITLILLLALSLAARASAADSLMVFEDSLPNGLRILTLEKHDLPVVSFQVWYKVGSRNERPGITGISHLLEHMMFKGTDRVSAEDFNRIIQKYGGWSNAFTSDDYTAYYENIASDFLHIAMDLESDRMSNLKIDPKEFDSERQVVKEERRLRENSPTGRLFEELEAAAYTAHPYGWPTLGWFSDLDAITPVDMRQHYRTFYAPNNATCVIAADITRAAGVARVGRYFGAIPRNPQAPPAVVTVEPQQQGERRVKYLKQTKTPVLAVAYHTCRVGDPDQYTLDVLANILTNGESSRLVRRLVHRDKIALYAGGYNRARIDPSLFEFYAAPIVGHTTDELEAAIYSELDSVTAGGVSADELRRAKSQIEADFIFAQQSAYGLASQIGEAATQRDWHLVNSYVRRIRSVTNDDIMRAAARYFTPENRTVAVLVNDARARKESGQ